MKSYNYLAINRTKGRIYKEPLSKYRTPFQRDRDRIIHSTAFRRLKHKTQVFVNTEGDHFRTRITHSIEVAQIARTISKYLNLNDDLTETLSLAHDLGHTPFGHAGEDALNECMINYGGFDHNLQTLRIVMFLEKKYLNFTGLNLTLETIDGLLKHNGPCENINLINRLIGIKNFKNRIDLKKNSSLEAQIASISDDIAYNNHDIQDGFNAKLFNLNDLKEIDFFKKIINNYPRTKSKDSNIIIYQMVRDSINFMVEDLINTTILNLKKYKIKNTKDVYNSSYHLVNFSKNYKKIINEIRYFLKYKMYNNKKVLLNNNHGKKVIKKIFKHINKNPKKYLHFINKNNKERAIADYISGMTDRYALNIYKSIK